MFDDRRLQDNVDAVLKAEQRDVPELLRKRVSGEERKEDPTALRTGSAMLTDVLAFDVASLIARRNGLGPATGRNGLRERVPVRIARGNCAKHMRAGYSYILANALLRMVPDPVVRTRLVCRPRELLRDEVDAIVAGSVAVEPLRVDDLSHVSCPTVPDVDLEVRIVTEARNAYRVALGNAVRPSEVETLSVDKGEGIKRARDWMRLRVFSDATLERLDGMLAMAASRRDAMHRDAAVGGGKLTKLFEDSLRAARDASEVRWEADVQARLQEQTNVTKRAEEQVKALVEAIPGTPEDKRASEAFKNLLQHQFPEAYCHRAALRALEKLQSSLELESFDLAALMQLRLALALDILGGASPVGKA